MEKGKPVGRKKRDPSKPQPSYVTLTVKGVTDWKEWMERAAAHTRMDVATFIDFSCAKTAKDQGFMEEPPLRLPK